MTQLYLVPLPNVDANRADKSSSSQIEQAGLLDTGGVATENVATDSVSSTFEGQIRWGRLLSKKVGDEIESLSESSYTALPFYDPENQSLGRARGYYELESADVSPAKPGVEHVFEYSITLNKKGTQEDSRRAIRTNPQTVDSVFPSDSDPFFLVPAAAENVRWFSEASGTVPATGDSTVSSQFGDVTYYNAADGPGDSPTLTYDLPFEDDGPTDVRVYDTRNRGKFAEAGGQSVNVWSHVYHTAHQFDGSAVIDTGRHRLYLGGDLSASLGAGSPLTVSDGETYTVENDTTETNSSLTVEPTGQFTVEQTGTYRITDTSGLREDFTAAEWQPEQDKWDLIYIEEETAWGLASWSIERIGPARVVINTRWSDGTDEQRLKGLLERGQPGVVWHIPENESSDPPQALKDLLTPISLTSGDLPFVAQGLIDRARLEE